MLPQDASTHAAAGCSPNVLCVTGEHEGHSLCKCVPTQLRLSANISSVDKSYLAFQVGRQLP